LNELFHEILDKLNIARQQYGEIFDTQQYLPRDAQFDASWLPYSGCCSLITLSCQDNEERRLVAHLLHPQLKSRQSMMELFLESNIAAQENVYCDKLEEHGFRCQNSTSELGLVLLFIYREDIWRLNAGVTSNATS
jgi:hypothetical protein